MTAFARLRDVFLPGAEPERAIFCTYGFDARFFETEVLPAMLPSSLTVDRGAGSSAGYLNAADVALQRREVSVFYDHILGDGPELVYGCWPVDVLPRRFHAKLMVLDYGERIRVVVGSANVTRPAWTSLLELWVVEDLLPGVGHPWAGGIRRFLAELAARIPVQQPEHRRAVDVLLSNVPDGPGPDRIVSSWDEPLLDAFFDGLPPVSALRVVSPFFEGSDGPGVFDDLRERAPTARGDLYVSVSADDGRARVIGPPAKFEELFDTGRWRLHGVRPVWDGDDDDAPMRALHGKLLGATHADGSRVMVGSANVTRAALLGRATSAQRRGPANVELVLLRDLSHQAASGLLPQADHLDPEDVEVVERGDPTGEDDEQPAGPGRHVLSASYSVLTRSLELTVAADAPSLAITYDGHRLGSTSAHTFRATLDLAVPRYVVVDDGTDTGIVPFTILDLARMMPRGTPRSVDLESFLALLAGGRDLPMRPLDDHGKRAASPSTDDGVVGVRGAIPWRRFLAAVQGLGAELERERDGARGLRFVLENPIRMAGLLGHLDDAFDRRRFTAPDLLYALYELEQEIARVSDITSEAECRRMLGDALRSLAERRVGLLAGADDTVSKQMALLERADAQR